MMDWRLFWNCYKGEHIQAEKDQVAMTDSGEVVKKGVMDSLSPMIGSLSKL